MKYILVVLVTLSLITACGQSVTPVPPTIDIDATVNARVQATQLVAQSPTQKPIVTQVVALASSSPLPPTSTSTSSPIPSTATPTPDPRLFWDDFEAGIKKEWHMTGDNFVSANGKLTVVGKLEGSIGDSSWEDYAVTLGPASFDVEPKITLLFRIQDRDNYMKMFCERRGSGYGDYFCDVFRVVTGTELQIPGTPFATGGLKLQIETGKPFELDYFDVRSLSSSARQVTKGVTPTPPNLLFVDDFNYDIKSDWGMVGDNFVSANGKLMAQGSLRGMVGNGNWANYRITLVKFDNEVEPQLTILFRVQNSDNYMKMFCERRGDGYGNYYCDVFRVVSGQEQQIPGTPFITGWGEIVLEIDAEGEVYRMTVNNEVKFRFVDNTFTKGGVILQVRSGEPFALDSFEVQKLP